MTREEEIMKAALDYANNQTDIPIIDEFTKLMCIALGQAFRDGAKWADEHSTSPKWKYICSFHSYTDNDVFVEDNCLRWGNRVISLDELKKLPREE